MRGKKKRKRKTKLDQENAIQMNSTRLYTSCNFAKVLKLPTGAATEAIPSYSIPSLSRAPRTSATGALTGRLCLVGSIKRLALSRYLISITSKGENRRRAQLSVALTHRIIVSVND